MSRLPFAAGLASLPALAMAAGGAQAGALPPQTYAWSPTGLYAVTTTPGRVTDIVLEPGESLVGAGAVAAGDTARWVIGQSESGAGPGRRVHILVKPTEAGLSTNLLVNTDRRTYRIEVRSTGADWTPSASWRYPPADLVALSGTAAAPARPAEKSPAEKRPSEAKPPGPDVGAEALNFGWRISGRAPFRPVRVFDDGRRTYIDFPARIAAGEMPPLFVLSADGDAAEVVNVRVRGARMMVDRLFERGELRLGARKGQARVRLERGAGP